MKFATILFAVFFATAVPSIARPADSSAFLQADENENQSLQNPMSIKYLKLHLAKSQPRLVLNKQIEKNFRKKLKTDPVVQNMYKAVKANAETIFDKPYLERKMEGRRLLSVSREMLYRINMLAMVYRMEPSQKILDRINNELLAVCNFSDWNPSHYLDVAEMSLAVALAVDWTDGNLPKATVNLANKALIEKGINPSWPEDGKTLWWVNGNNNWNQVCHAGMIAASIVVADVEPELAAKTIGRALEGLPHALAEYGPDGVYPEGSTYWSYGTGFSVITVAMLESAFGSDFGHGNITAFMESATFKVMANAPSGWYYNFSDCGDKRSENGDVILAWFASKTGNINYFEKDRFLRPVDQMRKLSRLGGAALVWISQYEEKDNVTVPLNWKGDGANPVVFMTGGESDPHQYYFAAKGGKGRNNHGNIDAGSFVFELNGVRWSIDPGNQSYYNLEKTGFNLWGSCQDCERWTLLTKNNYGHSTITVNNELHRVDGQSEIIDFKEGDKPQTIIDLSPAFKGQLKSAQRKFVKDSPTSLYIEDKIELLEETKLITWQMMTTADVEITKNGAILRQDGKTLKLENLSHPGISVSIVSLDPAPLELDRHIKNLKRIELRIPAWTIKSNTDMIKVRLSGE